MSSSQANTELVKMGKGLASSGRPSFSRRHVRLPGLGQNCRPSIIIGSTPNTVPWQHCADFLSISVIIKEVELSNTPNYRDFCVYSTLRDEPAGPPGFTSEARIQSPGPVPTVRLAPPYQCLCPSCCLCPKCVVHTF